MAGGKSRGASEGPAMMTLLRAIASGDEPHALQLVEASPELAIQVAEIGATRQAATEYFFSEIAHYVYAGDTAMHIAAAAYSLAISRALLARGASVSARNRRGAEPLHYAVDGGPDSSSWNPRSQAAVVVCLIEAGADPNSADKSGVTPLHRAVRTRCSAAVAELLANGADPVLKNGNGSTPLHLAVQNTGRSGSGSLASRDEQGKIIRLLLKHGARLTDRDAAGRTVTDRAAGDWILEILGSV